MSILDKERLLDAVKVLPVLSDPTQRQMVLIELREELGDRFDPSRHTGTNSDVWAIVSVCVRLDAVKALVTILKLVGGDTDEWRNLREVVAELYPPEPANVPEGSVVVGQALDQRIRAALRGVPDDTVDESRRHELLRNHERLREPAFTRSDDGYARDVYAALLEGTEPRAVIAYLEHVAHQLPEYDNGELHNHVQSLSEQLGLRTDTEELCAGAAAAPSPRSDQSVNPNVDSSVPEAGDNEEVTGELATVDSDGDLVNRTYVTSNRAAAMPQVWGGVPPRNKHFTGREEVLALVQRTLAQYAQSALVPQTFHGLGGIGKSQLAVEFAYRFQHDYQLVWWVQANDERSIRRSLVSLAKRLGLPESDDVRDTVDNVLDMLRRGETHSRWLLVYDDATDPGTVARYLPAGAGHMIVTSRNRAWTSESNAIEIDVFSAEESMRLIHSRWAGLSDQQALALAEDLGHLPLALEQAVAMHEQTGIPLDEYRQALKDNPSQLLAEGNPANYQHSVAATLNLAYNKVREDSPGAAYLLRLCAFLSSQPIALPLLTRGRAAQPQDPSIELGDDLRVRRAVRDLGRYALVQLDAGRDLLRVHNLVSALVRDATPEDEQPAMERHAHDVLARSNPGSPDNEENWQVHAQIASHVVPSGLVYSLEPVVRQVMLDQIRYQYAIGDYAESKRLGESAVEIWRASCGEDDELTLIASRHLSNSLRQLGEYTAARELSEDTLTRMNRTLGEQHEHSLVTAGSVAADMRVAGRFREALALDEENLVRHREILGEQDPHSLRALSNLAVDHRMIGDFERAAELDREAIRLKADTLGEDHMSTLLSYTCLVRDLYGLGMYRDGLDLARKKLPIQERRMPPGHTFLLLAKRNYAILLRKAGHVDEALLAAGDLYEACRAKFGRSHEHTLSALMTLGNTLRVTGNVDGAFRHAQRALTIYREVLGDDHPFTLACQANVAIALQAMDRLDEAEVENDQALAGLTRTLGPAHPHTLCALNTKANGLAATGSHGEAVELSGENLRVSREIRGFDHPNTLACAANHAIDLETIEESAQATALRKETFGLFRSILGREHPETRKAHAYERMDCDIEVPAS